MAEAAVQGPASSGASKYYCHQCSTPVDLSPDLPALGKYGPPTHVADGRMDDFAIAKTNHCKALFVKIDRKALTCPKCESGFIEELTNDLQAENAHQRTSQMIFSGNTMSSLISGLMFNPHADDDDDDDTDDDDDDDELFMSRWMPRERRANLRARGSRRAPVLSSAESRTLPRFLEHLLRGLSGASGGRADGSLPFLASVFHGDPRDYAWGADGLDNAITQLLNQWENSGTPPASKEAIDGLQSVTIAQEHVDKEMQCSVCMEDLCLNDIVRSMPCQHLYHSDCIVTWLQLHNTCPICRHSLGGDTVDDVASIQLPVSSDSSDEDDQSSPANQPTTTRFTISNNGSRLTARDAAHADSEDAVTMEVDCAITDSVNGWSASNVSDCAESQAVNDSSQVTTSSSTASPLQAINYDYWSDDYDSDY